MKKHRSWPCPRRTYFFFLSHLKYKYRYSIFAFDPLNGEGDMKSDISLIEAKVFLSDIGTLLIPIILLTRYFPRIGTL